MDLSLLESWLKRMQALKEYRRFRLSCAIRLATQYKRDQTLGPSLDRLTKILKDDIRRLSERVRVGQFIFENVAKAPWNTTEAFVRSHLMRDGMGRMELQGICDPSGRGEGYAFLRIVSEKQGPVSMARKPKVMIERLTLLYLPTHLPTRKHLLTMKRIPPLYIPFHFIPYKRIINLTHPIPSHPYLK